MVTRAPQVTAIDAHDGLQHEERAGYGRRGQRVLYVVSMFPCWSETFIVREIHALLRRGVDVRIVSLRRGSEAFVQTDAKPLLDRVFHPPGTVRSTLAMFRRIAMRPVATLRHPVQIIRNMWRRPVSMAKSLVSWHRTLGMLDRIEQFAPDHVHAHWATYASTSAMIVADHINRPFSFTAHAHDIYLEDQLMHEKLSSSAFVATISRFNREYLRRRHDAARNARIEIVHCGVPRRDGRSEKRRSRANRILSVGRLDEIKGFPVLLRACDKLRRIGVEFRCDIVGDGPQRTMLADEIRRLNLQEHVHMLGARPSQEVERLLGEADVFVLASQRSRQGNMDGIPVALMEAMASGTPVVSTAVSGIPELVQDQRTGLLVAPRDPDALARAMRRALEDETLRQRCIEGGLRKVRNEFDADTEGERLFGIIQSLSGEMNAQKIADNH